MTVAIRWAGYVDLTMVDRYGDCITEAGGGGISTAVCPAASWNLLHGAGYYLKS